ncbi:hypothetical protein [Nocardioides nanhaiensis]|uniref:DUF892 family protein n=1 Tax=Nocardioides nanhaiensis TaxID=1476871 RepID=A0ABP8VU08_9ACTN
MTQPPSPTRTAPVARYRLNPEDLRYLRGELAALRQARAPSLAAAVAAGDPAVRALAEQVGEVQLQGIRALVALLRAEGVHELGGAEPAPADRHDAAEAAPASLPLSGADLDLAFVALLGEQARAAIVRASAEMTGGMDAGCRGQAEQTIRDSWRDLAVLADLARRLLSPGVVDSPSGAPAPTA